MFYMTFYFSFPVRYIYIYSSVFLFLLMIFPCYILLRFSFGFPSFFSLIVFLPVLLRYNWHAELYPFKVVVSCWVLSDSCDPMDLNLPGSSVHGISQARILEWIVIFFSQGSSQPRNWTQLSCIAGNFFTDWAIRGEWHNDLIWNDYHSKFSEHSSSPIATNLIK